MSFWEVLTLGISIGLLIGVFVGVAFGVYCTQQERRRLEARHQAYLRSLDLERR